MKTRPTYTPADLVPRELGPFTRSVRNADLQRIKMGRKIDAMPATFDAPTITNPTAVAAIRRAFTQAKTSHREWRSYKREGRFDVRQATRASRGEQDVFRRKTGRSTTHVKVAVLIDASGSMQNAATIAHPVTPGRKVGVTRHLAAAVFGATIAKALGTVPTINLDIFQHGSNGQTLYLKYRWAKGTPISVFNMAATGYDVSGGGNADGHAVFAIATRMLADLKRDEHGVIMVVSDGLPSYTGRDGSATADNTPGNALIAAVKFARDRGITVLGVGIDGSDQSAYYGGGFVKFDGSWTTLGSTLAKHIGAALAGAR